ncbi:cytochrome C [Alsobacter soli]|uniref:Cytochrome C n=1 Tax=Alsobacter soli TaxID=2109933 RepID=A0A2T1HNY8_9HYPH|nr:cytochrome c [Alsobacter soli]PSC03372.1 cytochrome C [Alsobacter soli]
MVRRLRDLLIVAAAACVGSGFAEAASLKRGRILAEQNCGPCHAVGKTGASRNPKSPPFRTLAQRYPVDELQEALAEGITVGHEGVEMPEFSFSADQVEDLVAYIDSLNPKKKKR